MKSLRQDLDTFLRLLQSPVHISWSTKVLFADHNGRFALQRKKLQRQGKDLSETEIVRLMFYGRHSPALLLNSALRCLGKKRDDLRFFQKLVLPYIGHVVFGSPCSDCKKVFYICEKNVMCNEMNWCDVTHNPFALRLSMREDGHDLETQKFDVVVGVVDELGNVVRVSKGACSDIQNELYQTAHLHSNYLKLNIRLIDASAMSVYEKCEAVCNIFLSNLKQLVGAKHCKRLRFDLMILNNTDSLWQRAMFVKRNHHKVYSTPHKRWTKEERDAWQKSLCTIVIEIAQLVLLNVGKLEYNYSFLPDRLALVCDDIDADFVRQFLIGSCVDCVKRRENLQTLFVHFINIAESESEKNLSRSSTPNTSPLRENLLRSSPRSSPLRRQC